ncbi:hypothetical protein EIN_025610 [Entamoeba invadens IP1]|uniref:hypothetical protein n=1 Tax=Entamoeba invadens IP1 TaxID=370355 RepID=UPI0002C3F88B|nr:hypothetical protein EIN_025610 [Entamoeba invadens IP1]ELP90732.1 hypothetical protein EIN_025610 [Entamoeba invadens IP1]|eukprot:XP_004257503.1 hypothetical protein EIN_025610 [Entamoeba invadens IP1]
MEDFAKKPRSKTNTLSQKELKQESKSWEAIQQSLLIYLLIENGYSITIERPDKFAHLSKHFFVVTNVRKGFVDINFAEEVSCTCQSMLKKDATTDQSKQLKRHFDKSRASLCVNMLIDLTQKYGYDFTIRGTRSSIYTIKMEKFCEISKNGKVLYAKDDIARVGGKVNDSLREICIDASGRQTVEVSYRDLKKIEDEENSVTFEEIVSRSTSRGEIIDRPLSPISAFKRVEMGRNYFVL